MKFVSQQYWIKLNQHLVLSVAIVAFRRRIVYNMFDDEEALFVVSSRCRRLKMVIMLFWPVMIGRKSFKFEKNGKEWRTVLIDHWMSDCFLVYLDRSLSIRIESFSIIWSIRMMEVISNWRIDTYAKLRLTKHESSCKQVNFSPPSN